MALLEELQDLVTFSSLYNKTGQLKEEGIVYCVQFGLLEALQLIQSHLEQVNQETRTTIIKYAIKTQQIGIARYFLTLFSKEIGRKEARAYLEMAAEFAPIQLFEVVHEMFNVKDNYQRTAPTDEDHFKSTLMSKAVSGHQFENFD